jgi:anti-sigma B factor antagonist
VTVRSPRTGAQFGMEFDYDVGRTVVALHGELDALSVPAFAGALNALADQGARSVTIDLTGLRFCNIGGLRAMTELAARLHADDGRVEIVAPDILMRMLGPADLRSLFVIDERSRVPEPGAGAPDGASGHRFGRLWVDLHASPRRKVTQ